MELDNEKIWRTFRTYFLYVVIVYQTVTKEKAIEQKDAAKDQLLKNVQQQSEAYQRLSARALDLKMGSNVAAVDSSGKGPITGQGTVLHPGTEDDNKLPDTP